MVDKVLFSSNSVEWETPHWLFDELDYKYDFTLDPCCMRTTAKCDKFFTKEDDGLAQSWEGHTVFMNPPYGRDISKWIEKAYNESLKPDTRVVVLIPARTDTQYFHDYCVKGHVKFIKGRLKFNKWKWIDGDYLPWMDDNSAPFPSMLVFFGFSFPRQNLQYKGDYNPIEL